MKNSGKTFVQVIVIKDHLYCYRYLCAFFIAAVFNASQSYRNRNRELQLRHKDLALSGIRISENQTFEMPVRKLGSGDFVQGYAGFLWQSRSCTSLLPFSRLSFLRSHHKAEVPEDLCQCFTYNRRFICTNYKVSVGSTERYSATQNYL